MHTNTTAAASFPIKRWLGGLTRHEMVEGGEKYTIARVNTQTTNIPNAVVSAALPSLYTQVAYT
jgi:hypothetical protein